MSVDLRNALEARLNDLLTLADRLPRGDSEDCVRRCVCTLIEADRASQGARVLTLMTSLTKLQHERQRAWRRTQSSGAMAVDGLLASIRAQAMLLLPPRWPAATSAGGAVIDDATPSGDRRSAASPRDHDRWDDWKARGLAHDSVVRRRLRIVVMVVAAIAVASFWVM